MVNLFLYGTLRHPGLLTLVAGHNNDFLAPEPAKLPDHQVSWAAGHDFPLIEKADGAEAEGLLLRNVDGEALERLNYYELGFGYDLRTVTVEADKSGAIQAQVYFPQGGLWQAGARFSLEDWVREHWPLTQHTAAEVMGYFGRLSGAEVADRYRMIRTRAAAARMAEDETPCELRSNMGPDEIEPLGEELSHAGFFLLKTMQLRHVRFDGDMSEDLVREVFIPGDAATVLPYDPKRDRVLLIEQFRMGPYARGDKHPWQLEPIAGRIDGGETAETSCHREAEEEAGLAFSRLEPIARYYASPGCTTEVFHSFIGIADLPDEAAGIGGADEEHEDIRSHVVDFEKALGLIETGEADNGPLIVSLLWLARERDRLRKQIHEDG